MRDLAHFLPFSSRRFRILGRAPASGAARLGCTAPCVSGCFSLAAAARACSRRPTPSPAELRVAPSAVLPAPLTSGTSRGAHAIMANRQQPSSMPIHKYGRYEQVDIPRPHLAEPADHRGSALAVHRPAGRQPGPDRPDVARPQARDVRPAGQDGLQGDRGRLPGLRPDRLRLRALHHRGRGRDPGRRHDLRTDPGPRGPDRADGGVPQGRQAGHRPPVQRHRPRSSAGSSSAAPGTTSSRSPSTAPVW